MNSYHNKTNVQLIEEIESLKNRIDELEQSELKHNQTEQAIKTKEINLRNIIEHSTNLFYSHTPDHLLTYVSPQTRKFLDCEPEEAKLKWTEFVTDNPENEIGFILTNRAIKTGKIQPSYELELVGKKGRKLWVEVNEAPVVEEGQTVAIVGTLTDITDHKLAEEALIESKQMLSDVLNTIPVRVFWKDLDGVYLGCNQLFASDAGRGNPDEVIGDNDYNMGWAEQAELYRNDDRFVIESGKPKINYEEPQTTPEGKTIWLRTSKIPLLNSTGNIYGVLGTYEDITERKKAEEALLRSEAMFKGIFSQAPVGIELFDSEGILINANREALNIFGVKSVEEVKGFKLFEDPTISEESKIQLRNGLPIDYESEFDFEVIKKLKLYKTSKSGKCFLQVQNTPYNLSDKGERGFVVHVQNITERKEAEKALRDSEYLLSESQKVANLGHYELDILTGNWTSSKILDNIFGIDDNFIKKVEGWGDILHPASREEMLTYFNESVLKQHQKFDKEYRIIRISNGEERWVHGLGELEFDGNGNLVKMIGTIQDITKQKRSEEALQKSTERYRSLYQNTPAMLHSIDREGRLTNVSKYWLTIMGYSIDEVLGRHSTDFMTEESSRYATEVVLPKFYKTGSCRDISYQYVKKNGEVMDALLSAITENDEKGELVHSLSVIMDVTDRKRAEKSLKQSEEKFRALVESINDWIWEVDENEIYTYSSPKVKELLGYEPEEIVGKTPFELMPDDEAARVRNIFTQISNSRKSFKGLENKCINKNGEFVILETSGVPIIDANGKFSGYRGVDRDITTRKKVEEEFERSQAMLNATGKTAKVGGWELDAETLQIRWTEETHRIYEVPLDYTPPLNEAINFFHPDDRSKLEEAINNALKKGEPYDMEIRFITATGKNLWTHTICNPIVNNGKIVKLSGTFQDITDRKLAEEEINKLSHSVKQSPAIVIITNTKGDIEYVNPKFVEVTGYTFEEVIGKNPRLLKSGETPKDEYENLWKTITSGGVWNGDFQNKKKNGELYWEAASISPLKDSQGKITHFVAVKEDITKRKLAEDALKEQLYLNQQILETTRDGYILADSDGKIIDVNPAYCDMIGYTCEELLEMNIRQLEVKIPPEEVDRRIQQMISKGGDHFETKHKHKDGHILELDTSTSITYLDEAPRVAAFMRDITERKKSEEALRESEEKFRNLSDNSPNMIFINQEGKIIYANKRCEQYLGYTRDEFNSSHFDFRKLIEPEYLEIMNANFKSHMEGQEVPPAEYAIRTKSGQRIETIINTKLISYGGKQAILGIITDITERKLAEKRIKESHNRLRGLAERLQMIREEERATIAREIHDDLGQSLTALKMDISWLKNNQGKDTEFTPSKYDMMLDLINSTIQSVKRIATELRPGILDDLGLVPAIEWQAAEFQNRYKIQCNVSINKSEVIIIDEIAIAVFRIFQETLTNVARHSGATKVDVNLNFYDDNKLIMEIADNGVGIEEEQINSLKSLGLFGMRERVNILKGSVEITGEKGKGTKVSVSIPI